MLSRAAIFLRESLRALRCRGDTCKLFLGLWAVDPFGLQPGKDCIMVQSNDNKTYVN